MPEKVRVTTKDFMQKELIKTCILLDMYLTWAIAPSVQMTRWFPRYENMLARSVSGSCTSQRFILA